MRKLIITAAAVALVGLTVPAAAMPTAKSSTVTLSDSEIVLAKHHGGHGWKGHNRGRHYGWHRGRGHHYGWHRGRGHHYGWHRGHHRHWH